MKASLTDDWDALGKPRTLAGLMNLYESNYQRLMRLIPGMFLPVDQAESAGSAGAPLYLEVLERGPYTLTLMLTHRFGANAEAPRLRVKAFHDAALAQAMDAEPADFGQNLERQWERNVLLNKWLEFCLQHGHAFVLPGPRGSRPAGPPEMGGRRG